jgi:uncharacterized protein (DUF2237 family)
VLGATHARALEVVAIDDLIAHADQVDVVE